DAFSGQTRSTGGGLYASTLFRSGLYIDVIGKYLRNLDRYAMPAMGLSRQERSSHSWYLGAETGWRLAVAKGMYVEPQVELVYGA
ncbi:autotransporter outer membrane beta-barrel domain-containing protein, partial [Bacillus sp. SIMBA_006]